MRYISTRDVQQKNKISAAEAIKKGLSGNGGLYMPEELIKINDGELLKLSQMDYTQIASYILSLYLTDYSKNSLEAIAKKAYSKKRFPDGAVNVSKVTDETFVLELYHGPTSAFKDMALQIMPHLLSEAFKITDEKMTAHILVATSGDTGKAALEGFTDAENVEITVFYPAEGVSRLQKLQMDTQEGRNVNVCSVTGNFDDCQTGVKNIFNNDEIKKEFAKKNRFFSSANSINFGRLIPQVIYYFYGYFEMVRKGAVKLGEVINVTVPTGNFGNILAGYFAKKMGLPINKLICASNKNNILTDFFNTGIYNRNRVFHTTISPSMDILISSNLERLLWLHDGAENNVSYMKKLASDGRYEILPKTKKEFDEIFCGLCCDEKETSETIKYVFENYNYLIDTHTAVAYRCADEYMKKFNDSCKMLVLSTASAYKFSFDVYEALTGKKEINEFDVMDKIHEYTKVKIPAPIESLKTKKIRFDNLITKEEMSSYVTSLINS